MQNDTDTTEPWRYSHTQLALWKLCKRKYYNAYVLGNKEPTTPNMAAGTWLAQEPVEMAAQGYSRLGVYSGTKDYWEMLWANFLAEFGGDDSYDDPIFTLNLAKQILKAYKASPVQGKVVEIERTYEKEFPGGYIYTSRPDFVVEREELFQADCFTPPLIHRTTWDIKLKTFNQNRAGDTYYASSPLSAFDDQCLGQAILASADAFGQIQFFVGKKDGMLIGPVYVEQPVNPVLAREWEAETAAVIAEIDITRRLTLTTNPLRYWSKNDASCHEFGKPCHCLASCGFGFEVPKA